MFFIKNNIEEASLENIRLSSIPTKLNFKAAQIEANNLLSEVGSHAQIRLAKLLSAREL
jgi:hypothetical protein